MLILKSFEIVILFSIVEKSNKYTSGDFVIPPPTAPGKMSLSYKICPLFTCSICYWEICIHIQGGKFSTDGILHGDKLSRGGKFSGGEFFRKFFTQVNLLESLYDYRFKFYAWKC